MELADWAFEDTELSLNTMAARATLSIPMFGLDRAIASANGLLLRQAAMRLLPSLDPVLVLNYPDTLAGLMWTLQEFNRVLRASVALEDRLREFAERWAELPPIELACLYRYQFAQDQADREDALRQLAGRRAWRTSLEAREAIRWRVIQDQRGTEAIKLDELMAGLVLSIGVLEMENANRQGHTWITGIDRKKRPVRPVGLPF